MPEVIAPNLTFYQKEFLFSPARFTVTIASPKAGKTISHIYWLFGKAHEEQRKLGQNYWWVAPVYQQAEIAFNRLKNYLHGRTDYRFNESKLICYTPVGSLIHFKSAEKPDNLYGEDVFGAVFDEFTRARRKAWVALRTTLSATKAPCKLIGNYLGISNWGHHYIEGIKDNKEYSVHRVTIWDAVKAGIIDEAEVESIRRDPEITTQVWETLYLLKELETEDQLISNQAIEDLFSNDYVQKTSKRYITADIATHGSDKFVIGVWHGWVLVECFTMDKSDGKTILEKIKELRKKHEVPFSHICFDADGVGSFLKGGFLPSAISFNNGATPKKEAGQKVEYKNLKSQCAFKFAHKANSGEVYIQCEIDKTSVTEELAVMKNATFGKDGKLALIGKDKIKEIIGRSPDYADMLLMRSFFDFKLGGRKATAMQGGM